VSEIEKLPPALRDKAALDIAPEWLNRHQQAARTWAGSVRNTGRLGRTIEALDPSS